MRRFCNTSISDGSHHGRERQEVGIQELDLAREKWEKAAPEEKPKHAFSVLAHIGDRGGKLKDFITDPEEARAIKNDARRHKG